MNADVAIVGGGIMGASAAWQLAERGLRVTLVERDFLASGPTGKSSAIIRQHYSNELTARMALHSLRVFQNFAQVVGGECGYTRTGFVILTPAEQRDGLVANLELQRAVGIDTRLLDAAELLELAPGIAGAETVAAAYEPDSGYADPALTVGAMAEAARRHGATILQQTEVTGLNLAGGRVTGVRTDRGEISAGAVITTAGPWAARLAATAGVDLPIRACRIQVAFFAPPTGGLAAPAAFGDFPNEIYFRREVGGMTLAGSVDPAEQNNVVDPDHYDERVDFDFVLDMGTRLARRFPHMEHGTSRGGYAAIYDITPDWHPIIDEVLPGSRLFVAAGHSGHGFKLGPAVGLMLADLVTGQHTDGFDPHLFRLSRFAEGHPVRGRYEYSIVG